MANMFRRLRAGEIDCRVQTVKENGLSILLYKDARCDQNILDETVGSMNWQRSHSRENANCTVSIWDKEKKMWISKEDTGKESNTEAEKGLASDSFKRACFCWGIGRELYTAPFIWIDKSQCNIKAKGQGYTCYDRFYVSEIGYDDYGKINRLQIKNGERIVFEMGSSGSDKVTANHVNAMRNYLKENGIDEKKVCDSYKVKRLEDMTIKQHNGVVKAENLAYWQQKCGED